MSASNAQLGRVYDTVPATVDLDAVLDALKKTERSAHLVGTDRGISPKGAASAYQIIPSTFRSIKKLPQGQHLPDIPFDALNNPENEPVAREYAKAIVKETIDRGFTDPKDIASIYNSGKAFKRGRTFKETREYVPRFIQHLKASQMSEPGLEPVDGPEGAIPQVVVAKAMRAMADALSPAEAQAAEPGTDRLGAAFDAAPATKGEDLLGAAFDEATPEFKSLDEAVAFASTEEEKATTDAILAMLKDRGVIDDPEKVTAEDRELALTQFRKGQQNPILGASFEGLPGRAAGRVLSGVAKVVGDPAGGDFAREAFILGSQSARSEAPVLGKVAAGAFRIGPDLPVLASPVGRAVPSMGRLAALFAGTEALTPGTDPSRVGEAAVEGLKTHLLFGLAGKAGRVLRPAGPGSRLTQVGLQGAAGGGMAALHGGDASDVTANTILGGFFGLTARPRPGLAQLPMGQRLSSEFGLGALTGFSPADAKVLEVMLRPEFAEMGQQARTVGLLGPGPVTPFPRAIPHETQGALAGVEAAARAAGPAQSVAEAQENLYRSQFVTPNAGKDYASVFHEYGVSETPIQGETGFRTRLVPGGTTRREPTVVRHIETSAEVSALAREALNMLERGSKPGHTYDSRTTPDGQRVIRRVKVSADAQARSGAIPEAQAERLGNTQSELSVLDRVLQYAYGEGDTVTPVIFDARAVLPPAGRLRIADLTKADFAVLVEFAPKVLGEMVAEAQTQGFEPGAIRRWIGSQEITLAKDPRTKFGFETLDRTDTLRRGLGAKLGSVLVENLTSPRGGSFGKVIPRRLLPVEDLRLVGRALDGIPAALEALGGRPDLVPRVAALRAMLDEVAVMLNLPQGMKLKDYFPHIMRVATAGLFDIPLEPKNHTLEQMNTINHELNGLMAGLNTAQVRNMRDFALKGGVIDDAVASKAVRIRDVLSDFARTEQRDPQKFIMSYYNSVLRGSIGNRKLADLPVDISSMVPKRLFTPSVDKARTDFNPEFLEYDASVVLPIYLYAATRRIAWDVSGGNQIRQIIANLRETDGPNSKLTQYFEAVVDNFLGRNKDSQNRVTQKMLQRNKTLTKMSQSDTAAVRAIAELFQKDLPLTRAANWIRNRQFDAKIAANLVTPLVNSTQTLVTAAPMLSWKIVNIGGKERRIFVPGLGIARLARNGLWMVMPGDRQIRQYAKADGAFGDPTKFELDDPAFHHIPLQAFRQLPASVVRGLSLPFRMSEFNNRGLAYTTAFKTRMGELAPKIRSGEMVEADAVVEARLYARDLMNTTQFRGGRLGQALLFQHPWTFGAGQFKSFPVKTAEQYLPFVGVRSTAEKAHFFAVLMLLGGTGGWPILTHLFPDDEFPSVARAAGVDLSDPFGASIFGIPGLNFMDVGQFILGPGPGDIFRVGQAASGLLTKGLDAEEEVETEDFLRLGKAAGRFLPASAQVARGINEDAEGLAKFFGPRIAEGRDQ